MSRRSQRKAKARSKSTRAGSGSAWALRVIVALMILAAVGSVVSYMWLRSYLGSKSFRQVILTQVQEVLQADATMSPLRWDGFQVSTDTLEAMSDGPLRQFTVEGVRTGVDASGVMRGVWSVSPSRVTKLTAIYDSTIPKPDPSAAAQVTANIAATPVTQPWYAGLLPQKIETDHWVVNSSDLTLIGEAGKARMAGVRWDIEPTDRFDQIKMVGSSGKITLPMAWAPELAVEKMKLSYQKDDIYLTQASFRAYQNGKLEMMGEYQLPTQQYALEGEWRDVQCAEVLPPDWKQRLSGKTQSSFVLRSSNTGPFLKGHLVIEQGVLTALPVLDKLAAYSQSLRFRTLALHAAECDYEWSSDRIVLTNIQLGSEGLARLEGKLVLTRRSASEPYQLLGDMRLGLAPGTLSQIPGAEEDVFVPGEKGLLWAPLQITGTLDEPQEDLSQRLMAAAGARMFELIPSTGLKVLKYTQQVIGGGDAQDPAAPTAIDRGTGALQQGTDVIDKAVKGASGVIGGVVQGLFGAAGIPAEVPEPAPEAAEKPADAPLPDKGTPGIPPPASKANAAE
jgi:hypothetical protein